MDAVNGMRKLILFMIVVGILMVATFLLVGSLITGLVALIGAHFDLDPNTISVIQVVVSVGYVWVVFSLRGIATFIQKKFFPKKTV